MWVNGFVNYLNPPDIPHDIQPPKNIKCELIPKSEIGRKNGKLQNANLVCCVKCREPADEVFISKCLKFLQNVKNDDFL